MMRSILKVSSVLVVTSLLACSSKSDDEGTGNSGGSNGSIIGGAGTASSSGGTASSSGGTASSNGGTASSNGGTASSNGGTCNGDAVTCLDSKNARGCNPDTGMLETIDCAAELAQIGVESSGCTKDATGEGCDITGFTDDACRDGVAKLIACNYIATDNEAINAYASCFLHEKNMSGQDFHELVTCVGAEITTQTPTTGDCNAATDTCVGMGAAGSGAGGAAP